MTAAYSTRVRTESTHGAGVGDGEARRVVRARGVWGVVVVGAG